MAYKTILAVLDTPQNAGPITDYGIALAERFSAHLIGVHAETLAAVPLIAPMEIPDPSAVQILQDAAQKETAEVERIFRQQSSREGLSIEWRSFMSSAGYGSHSVMDTARSVDLIVASQSDPAHADHRADLETFLFDSGRPMLLVPYTLKVPQPIKRVMIAWNGSREAARATFDSMPFLKAADSVEVFCVDPSDRGGQTPEMAGAEIATTLARHGINVTLSTQGKSGVSAAAAIENHLSEGSVDLLVMGGYGHSRWWEMLFGGVTRSLLDSMTALTLLSR
ncbi:universal stress protein [Neorhizobium galegae]|uniref:universal stress protein n=1 Tax=Neorhizobium galegae TaxID=399 RepID=UPI0006211995|nr:universal stress protein [Neorhizobium galegae]CDZ55750.1 UspA domain protein [Neorhizobium galegae bv. orientalis]KAB1126043.1 universal stress protein [Neorhizobium galegae]MCQ1572696.1 universal stress protein [Neorhizobium galegae]MCQ1805003.1 universal stress protein [Neorhizobium galegae]MCQ1833345.1 universal stress protein [Neorhizobium galegae]